MSQSPAEVASTVFWKSPNRIERHEREVMYQAFKARLMRELLVDAPDLRTFGLLINNPNNK